MNFSDLIIIYLACGAPFGVYYFLQSRRNLNRKILWIKTFLHFVFWIPFALQIVVKRKTLKNLSNFFFDKKNFSDSDFEKKILPLRKNLESSILKKRAQLSVFEMRETLDRYIGLTLACKTKPFSNSAGELYKISAHKNPYLATICAERRNRQRLLFHQKQARQDFLNLFNFAKSEILTSQILELIKVLEDFEAQEILKLKRQIEKAESVKTRGELWKTETRKPLAINRKKSAHLELNLTMTNLRGKD